MSTAPNVSAAGNVLTMACFFVNFLTPVAKMIDVAAGNPSGIDPTIIAIMAITSVCNE